MRIKVMAKNILLADVDEELLISLERLLEDEGLCTTVTWQQEEALHLLSQGDFDAVVVGHHPPELNAVEVLARSHRLSQKPCLVLRAEHHHPFENEYLRFRGASAVMDKQNGPEIAAKLKEIVGECRLPQAG